MATKEIRANRFVVEDENGNERASLSVDEDGPNLTLYDRLGSVRALMCVPEDEGARLALCDGEGIGRVSMLLLKDGPIVGLSDENGKPRVSLSVSRDALILLLRDENGKERGSVQVDKWGSNLVLRDENGELRVRLVVKKDGPGLAMLDENQKVIWHAP